MLLNNVEFDLKTRLEKEGITQMQMAILGGRQGRLPRSVRAILDGQETF